MKTLTSGQMGRENRVSEKAMRIYEQKGLIKPDYVDENTGWRHYSLEQSTKLDLVLELQQIGFTLDEIVDAAEQSDVSQLRKMLVARRASLDEQIASLKLARDVTNSYIEGCDQYLYRTVMNQIMLEMLPERRVLMFELPPNLRETRGASGTSESFEAILRFTRQSIIDRGYPPVLFRDVCSVLNASRVDDPAAPFITHVRFRRRCRPRRMPNIARRPLPHAAQRPSLYRRRRLAGPRTHDAHGGIRQQEGACHRRHCLWRDPLPLAAPLWRRPEGTPPSLPARALLARHSAPRATTATTSHANPVPPLLEIEGQPSTGTPQIADVTPA